MKKSALILAIVAIVSSLVFQSAGAQERRHRDTTVNTGDRHSTSISIGDEKQITDCGQVKIRIGDGETARSQLMETVPRSSFSTLQVQTPRNGGVHVQGWNRDEFSVTACLGAAGDSADEANALLAQLKLSVRGGKVEMEGPNPQDWVAYLIVQ